VKHQLQLVRTFIGVGGSGWCGFVDADGFYDEVVPVGLLGLVRLRRRQQAGGAFARKVGTVGADGHDGLERRLHLEHVDQHRDERT
jgi:hypothetical protein